MEGRIRIGFCPLPHGFGDDDFELEVTVVGHWEDDSSSAPYGDIWVKTGGAYLEMVVISTYQQ